MKRSLMLRALSCATLSACNNAGERRGAHNVADAPTAASSLAASVPDSATKASNWIECMTPGDKLFPGIVFFSAT